MADASFTFFPGKYVPGMGGADQLYTVTVSEARLRSGEGEDPGFGVLRHYVFELTLRHGLDSEAWTVAADYEEMAVVHGGLRERHSAEALPAFPRKRHVTQFMYKEETQYLEEIRVGLQAYFTSLLASPALRMDPEARRFLRLHDRGRGAGPQPPPPPPQSQPAEPTCARAAAEGSRGGGGAEAPFRVTVLEADSQDTYFVRVQSTEVPSLRWSLIKTVSAMATLHDQLSAHHAHPPPPAFPRTRTVTKYLVYGSTGAYKEALREELEHYFNAVLSREPLRGDVDVRRFLELDEHTQRVRFQVKTACARCVGALKRILGVGPRDAARDLTISLQPQ